MQEDIRLAGLNGPQIARILVSGSSATVTFEDSSEVIKLRKTRTGWLINSA